MPTSVGFLPSGLLAPQVLVAFVSLDAFRQILFVCVCVFYLDFLVVLSQKNLSAVSYSTRKPFYFEDKNSIQLTLEQ